VGNYFLKKQACFKTDFVKYFPTILLFNYGIYTEMEIMVNKSLIESRLQT